MKLLIVTSLKEYQQAVAKIFEEAQIKVFSVSKTIGHKDGHPRNLMDNWFASGEEEFDSIVLFSFTADKNALTALERISNHNQNTLSEFPIRAFIVPVEQSSY